MHNLNHRFFWWFCSLKKHSFPAPFSCKYMTNPNGGLVAVVILTTSSAFAAQTANSGLCQLIEQLQGVFQTLRICAFVGAGFILAKYGWEAITTGKLGGKNNIADGLKEVGVPMIIGFALLFSIGLVLGFLSNGQNFGCAALISGW